MEKLCPKCQRPLPDRQVGPGRPKTFCSASCQRAAGFEITRVTRQISEIEGTLSKVRAGLITPWLVDVDKAEAEVGHLRGALHRLLLDEPEEKAG
jgi:hypothetical protein